jgi:four helix bundle protein
MKESVVRDKSFALALRMVRLAKHLQDEKKEFVLSRQVLRSGTAIGALIRETDQAQSRADFISKMNIALKEANETDYWLDLLHQSGYISQESHESLHPQIQEILKLLVSIVKTTKRTSGK